MTICLLLLAVCAVLTVIALAMARAAED